MAGSEVDRRAPEPLRDLRQFSLPVQEFEVQDVAELVLQPGIRQRLLRRLHVRGHDAKERCVVFRLARDRADVDGTVRQGLRHPSQLTGFVGHVNFELLRFAPPSSSTQESAGAPQKDSSPPPIRYRTSPAPTPGERMGSPMVWWARRFCT